jgi:hypothetical protein
MSTNKTGMGGQEHRGGTGVLDEEKEREEEKKREEEMKYQGGKEQGRYGQHKPEQGKQDFRHQDKGGKTEQSNEQKK